MPPRDPLLDFLPEMDNFGWENKSWMTGWPQGRLGVDRGAADYPRLEKAARALLLLRRALGREARREVQQVMGLLKGAAARTVAPALEEILALASGLVALLAKPRFLERGEQLRQRFSKLLEALLDLRYGQKTGEAFSEEGFLRQMKADTGRLSRCEGR